MRFPSWVPTLQEQILLETKMVFHKSQSYFSMELSLVKSLLWTSLLFIQIHEYRGCVEEERVGLLELKVLLTSKINNADYTLSSWVNETRSECCGWERVTCDDATGHVIKLSLCDLNQKENILMPDETWLLNVSLLLPFKELRSLDLSQNQIGSLGNQESNCLSKLGKLTHLNLGSNSFDKEILRFLSALPALKSLDLSSNINMEGPLSSNELVNLSNLEVLILRGNYLDGSLPFKDMANFSSLEILDLSGNVFTGSFPPYIGALSSLRAISLSDMELNGTLPIQELCALKKLEEFDLGGNNFEGILPPCLANLTSLRLLDISQNRFNGNLSSSLIANLKFLEYIDLSYNLFEGLFSFNLFANLSKLKVIQILSDNNKLDIEIENSNWDPMFQLQVLVLSNCNLNKPISTIPKFLFYQHELEVVALSHSKLKGNFPIWLLKNNTRLKLLNLRNNYLDGQFHLPPDNCKNLTWLDVSGNHLDGQFQENIGKVITNLEYLNLSQNNFEGNLPSSIGDISNLQRLDLTFNNFSGQVPMELVTNCTSLIILRLSNNNFHGEFFSKHFSQSFFSLELNNNHFTGTLPKAPLSFCILDISNNHMSGIIPLWMGNDTVTLLGIIDLSNNLFEGQLPCGLGSFEMINLSHNLLSGLLPSCLNLQNVKHLILRGNNLIGISLPKVVLNSLSLLTLDIRDNRFFGSIPEEIDRLSNLRVLLLSGNHFSGMIPKKLCQLEKIGIMDLSRNSFSGTIPYCFHKITFGQIATSEFVYINDGSFSAFGFSLPYKSLLNHDHQIQGTEFGFKKQVEIDFLTKYRSNLYIGLILDIMSALDLSFNQLKGGIPLELGQLSSIHSLNLSYNQLAGPIPKTFSNLTQLESLDLSYNNLSGEIPSTLIALNFLEVFNVTHNNFSGKVPDFKAQFGTFDKNCYEGNPFLCGPPLEKHCTMLDESPSSPRQYSNASDGKWHEVDPIVFYTSLSVSYIIFFLGVVSVLYINPHWQQRGFNLVEDCMYWCYFSAVNTLKGLSSCMCH